MIYTDYCSEDMERRILTELKKEVILRMPDNTWNICDAMRLITEPRMELAVINRLDEIAIMEISLLSFMCKPILVTAKAIREYPIIESTVDYVDSFANLRDPANIFIPWFKLWSER